MSFHVYENWTIRKARIHRSECAHCNFGRGKHAGSSDRNGRWRGSFDTHADAQRTAQETGQPVSDCGHCLSGSSKSVSLTAPPRRRRLQRSDRLRAGIDERIARLTSGLDAYLAAFDKERPFGSDAWQLHLLTLERRTQNPDIDELVADDEFISLLYRTLEEWGMNSRAAQLLAPPEFAARIRTEVSALRRLQHLRIETISGPTAARVTSELWELFVGVRASATKSFLVGASKALHHLLPNLVPPMDRRYTYWFFGYTTVFTFAQQESAFKTMYPDFARIAGDCSEVIARHVGASMHTSVPKTIDNAIIGYRLVHQN